MVNVHDLEEALEDRVHKFSTIVTLEDLRNSKVCTDVP
jgi:hypothetical protein